MSAEQYTLILDDTPEKLAAFREEAESADPHAQILPAGTLAQALQHIAQFGERIRHALIDYDLPDGTGAEAIDRLSARNRRARSICITARAEGNVFTEAAGNTLAAGADDAVSTGMPDWRQRAQTVLAL